MWSNKHTLIHMENNYYIKYRDGDSTKAAQHWNVRRPNDGTQTATPRCRVPVQCKLTTLKCLIVNSSNYWNVRTSEPQSLQTRDGQINTFVLGETKRKWRRLNFLDKQVFLVEEQNDGSVSEPLVVADGVKQLHALLHPILHTIDHRQTNSTVHWEKEYLHIGTRQQA